MREFFQKQVTDCRCRFIRIMKIGIKLLIVVCALLYVWEHIEYRLTIREKSAIDTLYLTFEGYLREGDFASAYDMMHPMFKSREDLESFTILFGFIHRYNRSCRLHPQRYLRITENEAVLVPNDMSVPIPVRAGTGLVLEKFEGKWYFTGETQGFMSY